MTQTNTPSPAPNADDRLDLRRILPIFVVVFVDLMGLTIIIPLLPLYAASFGSNAFMIGLLQASYPLMQFVGAPLLGSLSDRYGRKPVLVVSQIGTFIGFIMLGLAGSLPMLFLSRMIDGISGGNLATAQAALSDSTTPRTRAQGLGLIGAAFGLGFILGPAITGVALAISENNYAVPAFIAAAFSLASIIMTLTLFPETLPEDQRDTTKRNVLQDVLRVPGNMIAALRLPVVGFLLLLFFLMQMMFSSFTSLFAPLTLTRIGTGAAGNAVFFTIVGIIIAITQGGLIGPLSRRFGERRLIFAGQLLLAVGMLVLAFVPLQPTPSYSRAAVLDELNNSGVAAPASESGVNLELEIEPPPDDTPRGYLGVAWVIAALAPLAIGNAFLQPNINSLITKLVTPREIGRVLGVSASFFSAANTLGPLAGGAVYETAGATALFVFDAVFILVILFIALRRIQPAPDETPQAVPAAHP